MSILAIIPAPCGSRYLAGQPLSDIHRKPPIQLILGRVRLAHSLADAIEAGG